MSRPAADLALRAVVVMALNNLPKRRCGKRSPSLYNLQVLPSDAESDSKIDSMEPRVGYRKEGNHEKPIRNCSVCHGLR